MKAVVAGSTQRQFPDSFVEVDMCKVGWSSFWKLYVGKSRLWKFKSELGLVKKISSGIAKGETWVSDNLKNNNK